MTMLVQPAAFAATGDLSPLDDVIVPQWQTGATIDATVHQIDRREFGMDDADFLPTSELAARMREVFDATGLVHLTHTGLTDLGDMRSAAKLVIDHEMPYGGGANPRERIEPNVYEVGAPLTAWLHYHHEMAYVAKSTRMLGFLCRSALPDRGHTFVSDNLAVTDALLATEFGQKLKALGLCYHRSLTDRDAFAGKVAYGVYNHWQRSFETDDPVVAVARAEERGLQAEWGPDRLLRTRYYSSAFEYFPDLDRNVVFSSIADHGMWFDTWPLVQHLPYADRPLNLTFGDDTEMTRDELQQFVDVYDRFGSPIRWTPGDVAIVCNYRFAHGRPGIHLAAGEQRELGVVLGEQFDRVGALATKW